MGQTARAARGNRWGCSGASNPRLRHKRALVRSTLDTIARPEGMAHPIGARATSSLVANHWLTVLHLGPRATGFVSRIQ